MAGMTTLNLGLIFSKDKNVKSKIPGSTSKLTASKSKGYSLKILASGHQTLNTITCKQLDTFALALLCAFRQIPARIL